MSEVQDPRMERLLGVLADKSANKPQTPAVNEKSNFTSVGPLLGEKALPKLNSPSLKAAMAQTPQQRSEQYWNTIRHLNDQGNRSIRGVVNQEGKVEMHEFNAVGVDMTLAKQEERAQRREEIQAWQAKREAHPVRAKLATAGLASIVGGGIALNMAQTVSAQESPTLMGDRVKTLEAQASGVEPVYAGANVGIYTTYPVGIGGQDELDPRVGYAVDPTFFNDNPALQTLMAKNLYKPKFPAFLLPTLKSGATGVYEPWEKAAFGREGKPLIVTRALQAGDESKGDYGRIQFGPNENTDSYFLSKEQANDLQSKTVTSEGGPNAIRWNNLKAQHIIDANGAVDARGNNIVHQELAGKVAVPKGDNDFQTQDLEAVMKELGLTEAQKNLYRIDPELNKPDAQKTNWVKYGVNHLVPKVVWDGLVQMYDGDVAAMTEDVGLPLTESMLVRANVTEEDPVTHVKTTKETLVRVQLFEYKIVTNNPLHDKANQTQFAQFQLDVAKVLTKQYPKVPATPAVPTQTATSVAQPSSTPTRIETKTPVPVTHQEYQSTVPDFGSHKLNVDKDGSPLVIRDNDHVNVFFNAAQTAKEGQGSAADKLYLPIQHGGYNGQEARTSNFSAQEVPFNPQLPLTIEKATSLNVTKEGGYFSGVIYTGGDQSGFYYWVSPEGALTVGVVIPPNVKDSGVQYSFYMQQAMNLLLYIPRSAQDPNVLKYIDSLQGGGPIPANQWKWYGTDGHAQGLYKYANEP